MQFNIYFTLTNIHFLVPALKYNFILLIKFKLEIGTMYIL